MQELAFEIKRNGVKIGDGLVSYRPSRGVDFLNSTLAELTNSNDTRLVLAALDPSVDSLTANAIPFPIPDSPFTLIFGFLGDAIPATNVWAAFESVHVEILEPLAQHPALPIPNNKFEYEKDGIHLAVVANMGFIITWKHLSCILGGLIGFMTGTPEHYQRLICNVMFAGLGNVGLASVWYQSPGPEVT